jgi:antitoxin (DNA-binding transcriptional repressor) of toxin-antitoxin stability system
MKYANVAELKNRLSAYLAYVEDGEEIVVRNRQKAIARIIPMTGPDADEEEKQLVSEGKLRLPEKEMTKNFLDRFLSEKMPVVVRGTSVDALIRSRE